METWGRRGFAAAVITGGLIGLSGASGEAAPAYWRADARGRRPPYRPPAAAQGATRYGVPEYPADAVPAEHRASVGHRTSEAAEQTMITPMRPDQWVQTSPARHAAPDHGQGTGSIGLDSPTAALPDSPATGPGGAPFSATGTPRPAVGSASEPGGPPGSPAGGVAGIHGSDGFLAGNLAALGTPPAGTTAGTPIGALGPGEGSLGTRFDSYGGSERYADPGVASGRAESRHARPEQPEQYAGWFGDRSPEAYPEREPYRELGGERYGAPAAGQEAHTALVPQVTPGSGAYLGQPTSYPAEQPVRSAELVGVYPGGAHHPGSASPGLAHRQGRHGQPDSDASALGSLDSSDLFGSLSQPPR